MASGSLNVNIVIAFAYVKSQTKLKIKLKFYQNWVRLELSHFIQNTKHYNDKS